MNNWPDISNLPLSGHQREQLSTALTTRVAILSGGPGCGKSHCMGHLATKIDNAAFCAPTGRAAVRLSESLADNKVAFPCMTIHSLLAPRRNGHDGDGWGFEYNQHNRLPFKYVVCDESSMNDSYIMRCLISAIPDDGHLLLVGDPDQLPPVGKGRPFLDMINSGVVSRGHLSETHRFAGRIATACKQINAGEPWSASEQLNLDADYPENLLHSNARHSGQIVDLISTAIERFKNRTNNILRDVQVIVPKNEGTALSREKLNLRLQKQLNPNGLSIDGIQFRVGDKMACLKNGFRPYLLNYGGRMEVDRDSKNYVANGEIGIAEHISNKGVGVRFEGHKVITWFDRAKFNEVGLAYALTCHKCQGGQWPYTIVVCDDSAGARRVCSRAWWYTAISRSKKLCYVVGRRDLIARDCAVVDTSKRRTFLAEKLRERAAVEAI